MRKVPRTLQLLSRRQVAKICDCSPASITNAVRAGELRTVAITTSPGHDETRIPLESLLQYFEQQTANPWSASDLLELRRMPRIAELLSLSVEVVYRKAKDGTFEVLNAPGTTNRWGKRIALRSVMAIVDRAKEAPAAKKKPLVRVA